MSKVIIERSGKQPENVEDNVKYTKSGYRYTDGVSARDVSKDIVESDNRSERDIENHEEGNQNAEQAGRTQDGINASQSAARSLDEIAQSYEPEIRVRPVRYLEAAHAADLESFKRNMQASESGKKDSGSALGKAWAKLAAKVTGGNKGAKSSNR